MFLFRRKPAELPTREKGETPARNGKNRSQEKLAEEALTTPLEDARQAALEQLEDPELLKMVALGRAVSRKSARKEICVTEETRKKAVDRIHDQDVLYEIATDSGRKYAEGAIQRYAMSRITDTGLLKKAALSEEGHWQYVAAGRIPDQKALLEIFEKTESWECAAVAAAGIRDFDCLLGLLSRTDSIPKRVNLCDQLNFLMDPAAYPDTVSIWGPGGIGTFCFPRKKPEAAVTDGQRAKYAETVIHDDRELDLSSFLFAPAELEQIFWRAKNTENRTSALGCLLANPGYPPERILEALRKPHFRKGRAPYMKDDELRKIRERIQDIPDPETLLKWIRDPDTDYRVSSLCFKVLYAKDWTETLKGNCGREIGPVREEAVRAMLQKLPNEDSWGRGEILTRIVREIPEEMYPVYGITFSEYEREEEDGFGRYTVDQKVIHCQGYSAEYDSSVR